MPQDCCCCIWIGIFMTATWYYLDIHWLSRMYNIITTIVSLSFFYYVYIVVVCGLNYGYALFVFDAISR